MMYGPEKSDFVVVAGKPTNKAERFAAELAEPRTGTKGNADQLSTCWNQSQARVSQALERIRQAVAVTHPRWEPYAGKPHVRICAGGARQLASLPLKRREFIAVLGGAAAWPVVAPAQQPNRMRRIGILTGFTSDDPAGQANLTAFAQGLQQFGWIVGHNVRIETRWGAGDAERYRRYAAELVALAPDGILVVGGSALAAVQTETHTVPIVFVSVTDPVGAGAVASLARPGANATGFTVLEYSTSGKWLELLKEIAPSVTGAAVIQDPSITSGTGQLGAIEAVAPSLGMELTPVDVRDASGIEHSIVAFARDSNCGLIVTTRPIALRHRELIITLAAKHGLPVIYPANFYAELRRSDRLRR